MDSILEVRNLSRRFERLVAVQDLSFSVRRGEILGIIGPNGAGKTTVVNLISGVLKPSEGDIYLDGGNITGQTPHRLAAMGLCRTFQATTVLGELTVRENTRRGAYLHRNANPIATFFNLSSARERRLQSDERVELLLGDLGMIAFGELQAGSLPYGFQKTLGLAIALASEPSIVLLDEPVAGLSAEEADRIRDTILKVRTTGVTIVVIDHNMRFIKGLCDRVLVMVHGRPLTIGTPSEVLGDKDVVSAYLGTGHAQIDHQ